MTKRIIDIEAEFDCCIDGASVYGMNHRRKFHIVQEKTFKTTLKEWKKRIEEHVELRTIYEGTENKCRKTSSSFYACNYKSTITLLKEILSIVGIEELIYDLYIKKYRVRLIPTHVTDAVSYMKEHGMPRSEKIPARGIDIERYCTGNYCFDTIAHKKTFEKHYPKVASIIESIKSEVE